MGCATPSRGLYAWRVRQEGTIRKTRLISRPFIIIATRYLVIREIFSRYRVYALFSFLSTSLKFIKLFLFYPGGWMFVLVNQRCCDIQVFKLNSLG